MANYTPNDLHLSRQAVLGPRKVNGRRDEEPTLEWGSGEREIKNQIHRSRESPAFRGILV